MKVDGTNLSMIRGDTESITISIQDNDEAPILLMSGEDTIYFTVKLNTAVEAKILQKIITAFDLEGNAIIEIEPEDTKPLAYKSYKYDVQWVDVDGKVRTIVEPSTFKIEPEVTFE